MMGGRLIKYFGVAAQGRLDASILFSIIGYRLPEFLTLILPLGFFIGLMLVFGRLYVDHEMAVLNGSGISRIQLGRLLIPLTVVYMAVQTVLMVWMSPWGIRQFDQLTTTQAVRTGFDLVRPKEFISSGAYTIYAGALSEDRKNLKDIFFYQRATQEGKPDVMILAKEATRAQFAQYGMINVPDELLENYSKEMLKKRESVEALVNRVIESKLSEILKGQVTLNHKAVSAEEFNKMFE